MRITAALLVALVLGITVKAGSPKLVAVPLAFELVNFDKKKYTNVVFIVYRATKLSASNVTPFKPAGVFAYPRLTNRVTQVTGTTCIYQVTIKADGKESLPSNQVTYIVR